MKIRKRAIPVLTFTSLMLTLRELMLTFRGLMLTLRGLTLSIRTLWFAHEQGLYPEQVIHAATSASGHKVATVF